MPKFKKGDNVQVNSLGHWVNGTVTRQGDESADSYIDKTYQVATYGRIHICFEDEIRGRKTG